MNYSGKKKCHTVKFQTIISSSGKILFIDYFKEQSHDFNMLKTSRRDLHSAKRILADSGYQGLATIYKQAETPIKLCKKHPLTIKEKQYNQELSKIRIKIEHSFAKIKTFKIFSTRYRNHKKRLNLRVNLIAGICNFELEN